jgi:hypothetical protein
MVLVLLIGAASVLIFLIFSPDDHSGGKLH